MFRSLALAAVFAAILPALAEARPRGKVSSPSPAAKPAVGVAVVPVLGGGAAARAATGRAGEPEKVRVPFPPSSQPEPVLLRLSTTTGASPPAKPWCAGAPNVNGFCVVN